MTAYDDIASRLPIQQLADQVGASPDEVERAVHTVLPALLGGLQANAADPGGAASLVHALGQHDNSLGAEGTVDLGQVDTTDGAKITRHVFGDQTDQVIAQLGGVGGNAGLVSKLLPLLAPIVMAYLAKQMTGSGSGGAGGGVLGSILGSILSGAANGTRGGSGGSNIDLGDILGGLGGLLGGGTRR
jgi:hypothetical protein